MNFTKHTYQYLFSVILFLMIGFHSQAQVKLIFSDTTVTPGSTVRIACTAEGFTDITNFQFSLGWDANIFRVDSIRDVAMPFFGTFIFNALLFPQGRSVVIWNSSRGDGVTIPQDSVLFSIYGTAVGPIGSTAGMIVTDDPLESQAADVGSMGVDIGLSSDTGIVNIVGPYDFPQNTFTNVNCYNPQGGAIDINPTGAVPPYTYEWAGPNGFTSTDEDLTGLEAGTYQLTLSDASTPPFVRTFNYEITADFDQPTANAGDPVELSCADSVVQLTALASTMGNNIEYEWTTAGGSIVDGETTLTPRVGSAGVYQLIVTNLLNGCTDTSTVAVTQDTLKPLAIIADAPMLNCVFPELMLDATGSSEGPDFSYQWTTADGNIIDGDTTLMPEIDAPGTYLLEVTRNTNGCTTEASVTITADTNTPTAEITGTYTINCRNAELSIDGTASSDGPDIRFLWTTNTGSIVSGETTDSVQVNAPGIYILAVTNQANGCVTTDSVEVVIDDDIPEVDAGLPDTLTCQLPELFIDGSGSAMGSEIFYEWRTADGNIIGDSTAIIISVDQPGTYILTVRDSSNACTAMDSIMIAADFPEEGFAGLDQSVCSGEGVLSATVPVEATGQWTSLGVGIVETPDSTESLIFDLVEGPNLFVWTLSTTECPDYDSDTLNINFEVAPDANDDFVTIAFGNTSEAINVVANDSTRGSTDWMLEVNRAPNSGAANVLDNNTIEYTVAAGFNGQLNFGYTICNAICPTFCDDANVFLDVLANLDTTTQIANTITPNGDGVNDSFIIPELVNNAFMFPGNTLHVFDRWGNIVYKITPYENDWNGVNQDGKPLPEGTYYYLMQLEISGGIRYSGDITILR